MEKIDKGLEKLNEMMDIAKTELDHRTAEKKKGRKVNGGRQA